MSTNLSVRDYSSNLNDLNNIAYDYASFNSINTGQYTHNPNITYTPLSPILTTTTDIMLNSDDGEEEYHEHYAFDDGDKHVVLIPVPGASSEQVSVRVQDLVVSIKSSGLNGHFCVDFDYVLPEYVDLVEAADAVCINGVLQLTFPHIIDESSLKVPVS